MFIDNIKNTRHAEEAIFDTIKANPDPVVLWGAGELSWYITSYLRYHDIVPICICDNNPEKHGKMHLGLPVYSYEKMKEILAPSGGNYHIVVSTGPQYKDDIFTQLSMEAEKNPIWYLRGYEVCGVKISYEYVKEHVIEFEEAYSSLFDDYSRTVFTNVVSAKLSGDFSLYKNIMSKTEYFDEDIIILNQDEIFLDVGAYKGKDIVEFIHRTNGKYESIIALEPDPLNLATLHQVLGHQIINNVEIHIKGAWYKKGYLHFHDGREGSSRVSETADPLFPSCSIEVDTIDNILYGRRVSYISMDIEGAEHNAILGAEETIKKWKPKMAVCVYHKREDMFDIIILLKSFVPDYRFFMRHYTDNQTETVLYAI